MSSAAAHASAQPDRFTRRPTKPAQDLFLNNHVANRASRAQGKALLSSAAATFDNDSIKQLSARLRENGRLARAPDTRIRIHHTDSLGFDEDRFASMFLFMSIRSSLSAAVRLGIVGPLEAQRIQANFTIASLSPSPGIPGEGRVRVLLRIRKIVLHLRNRTLTLTLSRNTGRGNRARSRLRHCSIFSRPAKTGSIPDYSKVERPLMTHTHEIWQHPGRFIRSGLTLEST